MFVLIAVAGWAVVVVLTYYVARARRELRRVREATHASEDVALVEAIAETERESADRVARAETMAATDDARVVQQLADRVVREADRLSRIVDDLLDLSQIEAQEAPSRAPIPVRLLVSESVDLVQAAADLAEVPIHVTPDPPDIELACDRRQMRSALMNL